MKFLAFFTTPPFRVLTAGKLLATADGDPDGYAYLDYLELARPDGWQDPPVAATVRPFDDALPAAGADYLIVTHPLFAAQAERLAEAKRREGMAVAVADVENA